MSQATIHRPGRNDSILGLQSRSLQHRENDTPHTFTLTCGADMTRKFVLDDGYPYPRAAPSKYVVPILPLPLDHDLAEVAQPNRTTGCGTTVHASASRGGQWTWVGSGEFASSTVVLLPPEYFTGAQKRELGGVPRKEDCGCITVGVGCCVCGNTLGVLKTRCETHIKTTKSYPTSYIFLADAVSPPIPPRTRVQKTRTSNTPIQPTVTRTDPPAPTPSATRGSFNFDLSDWLTPSSDPPRPPSPSELQAMADELAAEAEEEEAEQQAAAARFNAEPERPTTQHDMCAWTGQALDIYSEVTEREFGRRELLDR
ncbi:hypothetical protein DFH07DRAFT_789972 [Mycena maculata]|uniref:Uncharacterized protein n=1 Tax=Mycena maculata TaxID=230809 RepID=A0AAD7KBK8_9AGAR|nr:hypothetical protein DFH07DRAFT_789972 [Mycena maculata]